MRDTDQFTSKAVIKVIGVGGGGGNAVNTMIEAGVTGVEFIACNTDVQALNSNLAPIKIQMGRELTKGLGAGANPDVGRDAALEDKAIIQEVLSGADMVFITAGMGGGTGTGAAPIIAQVARELGALTVGVVTKPFSFEGKRRKNFGEHGIQSLRSSVDTLITIPNQRLLSIAPPNMSMLDAFKLADDVLQNAVKGISDIINIPGRVNVDFADVKTIMSEMGMALMGIGIATGPNRASEAARAAINSPLLEEVDIEGATGILINITGSSSMTLHDISEASSLIQEAAHEDANIIFGAALDESMGDAIRVTVIATGFDQAQVAFPDPNHQQHGYGSGTSHGQQPMGYMGNMHAPQNQSLVRASASRGAPSMPQNSHHYDNRMTGMPQHGMSQGQPPARNPMKLPNGTNGTNGTNGNPQNPMPHQMIPNQIPMRNPQEVGQQTYRQSQHPMNPARAFHAPDNDLRVSNSPEVVAPRSEIEALTQWTLEMSRKDTEQMNQERMIAGACSAKSEEHDNPESAYQLAKELAEVQIDESDYETPAYLRRREEPLKNP